MRIAQIAPLWESVPPTKYGGTERIVGALTEELVKRGHHVTLFASGDSITSAKLFSLYPISLREAELDQFQQNSARIMGIGLPYKYQDEFDIIHDHNLPSSLPAANLARTPVVATIHGPVEKGNQLLYESLTNPHLVSISKAQVPSKARLNHVTTIHHGLSMNHYPFSQKNDGYLLYVGRIAPVKGVHHAITVAKKLNLRLVIAAKLCLTYKDYFEKEIKPQLSEQIRWIGEVTEKERNQLMANCMAFLHPACWDEPFGLTMIEALACGAPVVAFNRGSVPDIVVNGKTGYVVNTVGEMINAVSRVGKIKRTDCRQHALSYFNVERMTDEYEMVYKAINEGRYRRLQKTTTGEIDSIHQHSILNKGGNGNSFPI